MGHTLYWVIVNVCFWLTVPILFNNDIVAAKSLYGKPVYLYSAIGFVSMFFQNLISFVLEDSFIKRELAIMSMLITLVSAHSDIMIYTGNSIVRYDLYGKLFVLQRYIQWSITTPTMLLIMLRISNSTNQQRFTLISMDLLMLFFAYLGNVLNAYFMILSFICFGYTLHSLSNITHKSLKIPVLDGVSLICWSIFPVSWLLQHMYDDMDSVTEYMNIIGNISAKMVFSSSIMYENYKTFSDRQRSQEDRRETDARTKMIEDLQVCLKNKDDFINMVSHEFRTPLNGILQLTESVIQNITTENKNDLLYWLYNVSKSAKHLQSLIESILILAAVKQGKIIAVKKCVNMIILTNHVVSILKHLCPENVKLTTYFECKELFANADEHHVTEIILNVLSNSLKYTRDGIVSLEVLMTSPEIITIRIKDTGVGISQELIQNVYASSHSVKKAISNTGLGLGITKMLIDANGGIIDINSKRDIGTEVIITLPAYKKEIARTKSTRKESYCARNGICMILNVDDEEINQIVIESILRNKNFVLEKARTGEEAMEFIESNDTLPDLILLDIMMPGMNGLEVCQKIRTMYNHKEIPIIMVSAKQEDMTVVECFELGANDYIKKPYSQSELYARIQVQIRHHQETFWSHIL